MKSGTWYKTQSLTLSLTKIPITVQERTSYHTYVKLLYVHGKLEPYAEKLIPSSTRHNWKGYDFSKVYGANDEQDFNEKLRVSLEVSTRKHLYELNRVIIQMIGVWNVLLSSVKNKKEVLKRCSGKVVKMIEILPNTWKANKLLSRFGISTQQYNYWKRSIRKCGSSLSSLCRIRHPQQLTQKEVRTIKSYMVTDAFRLWPARSIYYQMLNDGKVYCSLATFYNYLRWLGLSRQKRKFKKSYESLKASRPFEKLHMDVTIFRFPDHTKAYIYLIIDNFSRAVLNWKVSTELKASISFENIREVFDRYGLYHQADVVELIVDDGSENKKEVDAFVNLADSNVKKLVAQVDIVESNSMVEAANKILKYQYLFPKDIRNTKQLCDGLAFYQEDFNNLVFRSDHATDFGVLVPHK